MFKIVAITVRPPNYKSAKEDIFIFFSSPKG